MDLGGHGESGTGREAWTIQSYGADVAAVIEELGLERSVLVGHSMGGDVIMDTARRLPGRVAGLVWVDTYSHLGRPRSLEQVEAFVGQFRGDFRSAVSSFVRTSLFRPGADSNLVDRVAGDMASAPPDLGIQSIESSFMTGRVVSETLAALDQRVVAINPAEPPTDIPAVLPRSGDGPRGLSPL